VYRVATIPRHYAPSWKDVDRSAQAKACATFISDLGGTGFSLCGRFQRPIRGWTAGCRRESEFRVLARAFFHSFPILNSGI